MEKIFMKARAKVNLSLMILDKRQDNYHNIKSVFQKINLYDEIYVSKIESNDLILESNIKSLKSCENIIYKAYAKIREKYNISGVKVILNKKIPMQAGLAGGSTDCATFILCMNRLFNLNMSKDYILQLSKSLGADVIPCLYNKALIAEEIGNKITEINTTFKYYILIVKPNFSNSTKKIYQKIDEYGTIKQVDNTDKIVNSLINSDINLLGENLYNVFEHVVDEKEKINKIKEELMHNGAIGSLMTGSGSCIYGIFENKNKVKIANSILKEKYKTYICTSFNSNKIVKDFE